MGAAQAKDQRPVHGRGQRRREPQHSSSRAAATSTDASIAAAAQGSAIVSRPPRPPRRPPRLPIESLTQGRANEQPGDGGGGTDGSSLAAAAVDRRGKKQIPDDREQLSDRKGEQPNCPSKKSVPHVYHQTIPMGVALYHYFRNIDHAFQQPEVGLRLKFLDRRYSEFRPVIPDRECLLRSFIFSYLEQVVDRIDTHEEDRLLAAVRELARQADHFQWASEFSRRREAFERLIVKIKGWKRMWDYPTSRVSYNRGEFLLEFFSSYDTTDDIFAFLRLVAATWMCTHSKLYGRRITLGESRSLEDWCLTRVIPLRGKAYWVIIRALAEALGVAVRLENVNDGTCQNTHYNTVRGPHVTLLRIKSKYDIIYPFPPSATSRPLQGGRGGGGNWQHPAPAAETSSGGAGQEVGDPAAETSSGGAARAGFWWFDCCFVVPKKSRLRGSMGSGRSSHGLQSRPSRTEPNQSPCWLTSPS